MESINKKQKGKKMDWEKGSGLFFNKQTKIKGKEKEGSVGRKEIWHGEIYNISTGGQ